MLASLLTTFSPCDWLWNGQWQHGTHTKKPKLCIRKRQDTWPRERRTVRPLTYSFVPGRPRLQRLEWVTGLWLSWETFDASQLRAPSSAKEGKLQGKTKLLRELGTPGDTLVWSTSRQVLHTGWVSLPEISFPPQDRWKAPLMWAAVSITILPTS